MVLLTRTIEFLLLPPANLLLFFLLAWLFRKRKRLAIGLLGFSVTQLLILSLPITADALMQSLTKQHPVQAQLWKQDTLPQAIVVLGAGRNQNAPDYGGETTSLMGVERLRYAAHLHRKTGLPILVSGGSPQAHKVSEAALMRDILEQEFQVPVRWLEEKSHTTWQNAQYTNDILRQAKIQSAWLVTQNWHMPRSLYAFQNRQVKYHPAPTSFGSSIYWTDGILSWVPQSTALQRSLITLHEWIGLLWYSFKA